MSIIEIIKQINRRPNWDEYFMACAQLIANRSSCDRLHVGCLLVNNKRIIATGYNGHIRGSPHISVVIDGHEQMTIHAETNAITDSASRGVSLQYSTAYVTHYPCINCAKNLISAGIKEVIYGEDINSDICAQLYLMVGVRIHKYINNYLNQILSNNQQNNQQKYVIGCNRHIIEMDEV